MTSLLDAYRGRTVLVTGHTGFKGGWLSAWLKLLGARVVGFSLPPASDGKQMFAAARIGEGMVSVFGDVRDLPALETVFREHSPEMVFHLAAQPLVRRSYAEPVETYATNVMGTVHVLEAARRSGAVRALVSVTSDKCYENREWVWGYREDDPVGGHDPYSSSKGCAELVTAAYRRSFHGTEGNAAVASARAGNVIGGGDWAEDRLVPDLVRAISSGTPAVIRNPHALRPWQHVLEPLSGYLLLGTRLLSDGASFAEGWNFGPHDDQTVCVRDVAEQVIRCWGAGDLVVRDAAEGPHEAHYLKLDSSKAQRRLAWRPLLALEERIGWTVDWYRSYADDPQSAARATVEQIEAYSDRWDG